MLIVKPSSGVATAVSELEALNLPGWLVWLAPLLGTHLMSMAAGLLYYSHRKGPPYAWRYSDYPGRD